MSTLKKPLIAFLGTGLMGRPMAKRLLDAGYPLVVFNRTIAKAKPLRSAGAEIAGRSEEAIRAAKCVLLMLANAEAIHSVLLSQAALEVLNGRTVIQMGTIGPRESQAIQLRIEEIGGEYFEAPVLGGPSEAEAGKLIGMVGGNQDQFDRFSDVFQAFGSPYYFVGPVGKAAALKLALNQLIGSLATAFALSLGIVLREDISVSTFMEIVRQSSYYAPTFDKKLQRMLDRDFTTANFPIRLMLKDVNLILDEAAYLGLETYALNGVRNVLLSAIERGWGEEDYSAVFNAVNPIA